MDAAHKSTVDYTVAPGQVLTVSNLDGIWMQKVDGNPLPGLTISGELDVTADATYSDQGLRGVLAYGDSFSGGPTFTITSTGVVNVVDHSIVGTQTYGFESSWSPDIVNAGHITVSGAGRTTAVDAPFPNQDCSLTNSGFIKATSTGDVAFAVNMAYGGNFRNTGSIEADAHATARAVSIDSFTGTFYNSGSITATSDGAGYSVAVVWKSTPYQSWGHGFVNDGTLQGQYALLTTTAGGVTNALQTFTNNGAMIGQVQVDSAPTQLFNDGRIDGPVLFGDQNDLYDGHAGQVSGTVTGGAGDDTLTGGAGTETLLGGDGNDVIDGGGGSNLLDGGAGVNTLSFRSAVAGSLVDLAAGHATGSVDAATETFSNFQRLIGSDHGDTITASGGADTIQGGAGDDLIYAAGGQASLSGGGGVDTLSLAHAAGPVTAHFADGSATGLAVVTGFEVVQGSAYGDTLAGGGGVLTLSGGVGADALSASADTRLLSGGDGDDSLQGSNATDTLFGGGGNDSITGGTGFNQVNGNQGDDIVVGHSTVGDWLLGGQGQDSIDASASSGNNIINGNIGADTLIGGAGNDTLRGGQGDDVIHAGPGNDWISGDLGNNTIYGGQGQDSIHAGAGHDVVNGWHAGDHVLVAAGVTYTVAQVNADVHVTFSNGGEIDLLGVQQPSLQSDWILST